MSEQVELDIRDILKDIKQCLRRAGWDKEKTINHLTLTYHKTGILQLDDSEIMDFLSFCLSLKVSSLLSIRSLKLRILTDSLPQAKAKTPPSTQF